MSKNRSIQEKTISVLPNLLCITKSDFVKTVKWDANSNKLVTHVYCVQCHLKNIDDEKARKHYLNTTLGIEEPFMNFSKISVDESFSNFILKHALAFISGEVPKLKAATLELLPSLSTHVKPFHSKNFTSIWVELAGDGDKQVRKKFTKSIEPILTNALVSKMCILICKMF